MLQGAGAFRTFYRDNSALHKILLVRSSSDEYHRQNYPKSPDTAKPRSRRVSLRPRSSKQQALLKDWAAESAKFQGRSRQVLGRHCQAVRLDEAVEQGLRVGRHPSQVVHWRAHQHHRQCARPACRRRKPQSRGLHLAGRRRQRACRHLRPALSRCLPLCQWPEVAGSEEGRPRRHLHAAHAGRRDLDAGLRPHRRHPLGGLCRTRPHVATRSHRRCAGAGRHRRRCRRPSRQARAAEAALSTKPWTDWRSSRRSWSSPAIRQASRLPVRAKSISAN